MSASIRLSPSPRAPSMLRQDSFRIIMEQLRLWLRGVVRNLGAFPAVFIVLRRVLPARRLGLFSFRSRLCRFSSPAQCCGLLCGSTYKERVNVFFPI